MRSALPVLVALALTLPAPAWSQVEIPLLAWQAPPFWSPPPPPVEAYSSERSLPVKTSQTSSSSPLPFVAITACRQYNSHSVLNPLPTSTPRDVTLSGSPCGFPSTALAAAVNITVFNITGATGNGVFKVGNVLPPTTAWINYPSTETQRANAGVVPLDTGGVLHVQVNQGAGSIDVIIDVFGYYAPAGIVNSLNTLNGDLTLAEGSNITITTSGTVSVAPGGISSSMIAPGAVGLSQIDGSQVQARVTSACPSGTTIQSINPDGSVVCADNPPPQAGFSLSTVDSAGSVGSHTSITVGTDGLGLISYYDWTNGNLKVAHCSNVDCSAATYATLDSTGDVGQYTSITIGSNGLGLISYYAHGQGDLKVSHCSNALCTPYVRRR